MELPVWRTPTIAPKETSEKWAVQIGGSWNESCTPPLILGRTIVYRSWKIYLQNRQRRQEKILAVSDQLKGSLVFRSESSDLCGGNDFCTDWKWADSGE